MKTKLLYLAMLIVGFYILYELDLNIVKVFLEHSKGIGKLFGLFALGCLFWMGRDVVKKEISTITNKFK